MHFDVCKFCGHFGESGEEGGRRYIRSSLPITSDTVESGLAIIGVNFSERRSAVSKGVEWKRRVRRRGTRRWKRRGKRRGRGRLGRDQNSLSWVS